MTGTFQTMTPNSSSTPVIAAKQLNIPDLFNMKSKTLKLNYPEADFRLAWLLRSGLTSAIQWLLQ